MKSFFKSLLFFSFSVFAYSQPFVSYHEYTAQDKEHVAQLSDGDRDATLIIKNQETGEIELSKSLIPRIVSVQWAPNSKSLVLLGHLAGGSKAVLVHLINNEWFPYDCDPPLQVECKYAVEDVKFLRKYLRLTYRISQRENNEEFIESTCVFDVNYDTGFMILRRFEPVIKSKSNQRNLLKLPL